MSKVYTGDPSDLVQYFPKFSINILCCRFWWLKNWEHQTLAFPFWRIYYNFEREGIMEWQGKEIQMDPGKIYMISPNTDYKSKLYDNKIPKAGYRLKGGSIPILSKQDRERLLDESAIEHLFIHFTLGFPYDSIFPGIYTVDLDDNLKNKIDYIKAYMDDHPDKVRFNIQAFLVIQSLICEMLKNIEENHWEQNTKDARVSKIINYIENNLEQDLSNDFLSNKACMSPNSFSRLFKNIIGIPLQKYVKKKRIDYACLLITHTDLSIDEIASKTGFSNRFHFTRIFHEITHTTPAKYKTLLIP